MQTDRDNAPDLISTHQLVPARIRTHDFDWEPKIRPSLALSAYKQYLPLCRLLRRWQVYHLARLIGKVVRLHHKGTLWRAAAPLHQRQQSRRGILFSKPGQLGKLFGFRTPLPKTTKPVWAEQLTRLTCLVAILYRLLQSKPLQCW